MTYIRAKEIPPKSGNWYDYEVKTTREGKRVIQKVVRYIGKASADHIPHGGTSAPMSTPATTITVDNTHITKMKTPVRKSVKVRNPVMDATLTPVKESA